MALEQRTVLLPTLFVIIRSINDQYDAGALGCAAAGHLSVWGWLTKPSQADVDKALRTLTLLDEQEMRELFPDAKIIKERFLGMVKSLIAVRP